MGHAAASSDSAASVTPTRWILFKRVSSRRAHLLAQRAQCTALLHRAWQRMADDVFGEAGGVDQEIEVYAGVDAHFLTHEDEVFGADVAGGAFVRGERAAAEAADARVVDCDAHFEARVRER